MRRAGAAALAAVLALGTLAGCRAEPSSSGAGGVVVDRDEGRRFVTRPKPGRWEQWRDITVQEDGGKRDTGGVSREVYESCQVGDRWPDCKP